MRYFLRTRAIRTRAIRTRAIRTLVFRTLVIGTFALECLLTGPKAQSAEPVLPKQGICAHRGDSEFFPENTLPAFRSAIAKKAEMIEFDVARTKDGKLILMHDERVDRTTNGKGWVKDLTLAEIRALDAGSWKEAKFAGTQVPTLDEALDGMPQDIWLNIHLKGNMAAEVALKLKEKGLLHQAFLTTNLAEIQNARKVVPEILTNNIQRAASVDAYCQATIDAHCNFIQLNAPTSPKMIQALKDAGVLINYFPCNSAEHLAQLRAAGVDFPLTDKLDRLKAADQKAKNK